MVSPVTDIGKKAQSQYNSSKDIAWGIILAVVFLSIIFFILGLITWGFRRVWKFHAKAGEGVTASASGGVGENIGTAGTPTGTQVPLPSGLIAQYTNR